MISDPGEIPFVILYQNNSFCFLKSLIKQKCLKRKTEHSHLFFPPLPHRSVWAPRVGGGAIPIRTSVIGTSHFLLYSRIIPDKSAQNLPESRILKLPTATPEILT